MNSKNCFGLAMRVIGLLFLLYLLTTGVFLFGFGMSWTYALRAIVLLAVSLYLLRGAPLLLRFAYPDDESKP